MESGWASGHPPRETGENNSPAIVGENGSYDPVKKAISLCIQNSRTVLHEYGHHLTISANGFVDRTSMVVTSRNTFILTKRDPIPVISERVERYLQYLLHARAPGSLRSSIPEALKGRIIGTPSLSIKPKWPPSEFPALMGFDPQMCRYDHRYHIYDPHPASPTTLINPWNIWILDHPASGWPPAQDVSHPSLAPVNPVRPREDPKRGHWQVSCPLTRTFTAVAAMLWFVLVNIKGSY